MKKIRLKSAVGFIQIIFLFVFFLNTIALADSNSVPFYAYYTKINSGEDFEKFSRTGPYADIVVQLDSGQLIFHRSSSYLPFWKTETGAWYVDELVPRKGDGNDKRPDRVNAMSYARIIDQSEDQIIIHWRYLPEFSVEPNPYHHADVNPADFVDEYFFIHNNGDVKRTVRRGTDGIEAWQRGDGMMTQQFRLTSSGIAGGNLEILRTSPSAMSVQVNPVVKESPVEPVLHFRFDEGKGTRTIEEKRGKPCTIHGHKAIWKAGVSGTALQFDGYESIVCLPAQNAPELTGNLTLEAWIAVGAYPWNWAPILKQGDDEGFFLGLNSRGRIGLKVQAEGEWHELTGDRNLKTFTWYHVCGSFNVKSGEMNIYLNGELNASRQIVQSRFRQEKVDIQIGKGMKREATDVVRYQSDVPAEYGFDGLIDEVKIYNSALSAVEIESCYKSSRPGDGVNENPDMQSRTLPITSPADKFGAWYTRLHFYETWDNLWRIGPHADLIVDFENSANQFAFWRGTSYIPQMVTNNGIWFNHEFNEIWATESIQCMEPLADIKTNYSHVRLIENTDARVVVHWRYALNDALGGIGNYDPETGWGEFADWYYTIYPDGVAAVKMVLWSNLSAFRGSKQGHREWQESIAIIPPGKKPEDIYEIMNCMSVSDLNGKVRNYDWGPDFDVTGMQIQVINLKSEDDPFIIGNFLHGNCYYGELTEYSMFPCWNHWPAAISYNDGRNMLDDTRIGHSSTTQLTMVTEASDTEADAPWVMQYKLEGLNNKSAGELAPLARSWMMPAKARAISGIKKISYDRGQRAYIIEPNETPVKFSITGSKNSPVLNPAFVIKHWNSTRAAKVRLDGKTSALSADLRQGIVRDTDGTQSLILYLIHETETTIELSIE